MNHSKISFWLTILFISLLTLLHIIKPEVEPTWRFISEYSIGTNGWLMSVAFFAWAGAYFFMFFALRKHLKTGAGKIGLALLVISTLGLSLAGIFTTDPATTQSASGKLHNLGGTLSMAIPFAILFISIALMRNVAWMFSKLSLKLTTILAMIGFLVSAISLGVMLSESNGKIEPGTWVGLPTRFEVLTYCLWLLTASKCINKLFSNSHAKDLYSRNYGSITQLSTN